jgi:hypothetical protein
MAFNIQFTGWYLFAEILTLLTYLTDAILLCKQFMQLKRESSSIAKLSQSSLAGAGRFDLDEIKIRVGQSRVELTTSVLSLIPFSWIFWNTKGALYVVNFLRTLRMIKVHPLIRALSFLKRYNLNLIRLLEIILAYYVVAHLTAGIMLSVGLAYRPDVSNTWLNKVPIPLPQGITKQSNID